MLAPLAPHIACELWSVVGGQGCVLDTDWPVAGGERAQSEVVAVQIGGKLRGGILDRFKNKTQFPSHFLRQERSTFPRRRSRTMSC